jgi:hypothetical protein
MTENEWNSRVKCPPWYTVCLDMKDHRKFSGAAKWQSAFASCSLSLVNNKQLVIDRIITLTSSNDTDFLTMDVDETSVKLVSVKIL